MSSRAEYFALLARKARAVAPEGMAYAPTLSAALHPFQRDVTAFCLAAGRAAMLMDTGLGKTRCQIEWARHVPGRVLILAPPAVAPQTVEEARSALGVAIHHSRDGSIGEGITITNYERLHYFDVSQFTGVVLDESSILKSFMGKTKRELCRAFARTPFRLACTATPAPNDHMELGNHADFLGVMKSSEMLSRWFINDSMKNGVYRLKKHAEEGFWAWVASWAACVGKPSDLGYEDGDYELPPLEMRTHILRARSGHVREGGLSATNVHADKRATLQERVRRAALLANRESAEPWIVWCETNDESAALAAAIPDAVEVVGSDDPDEKGRKLMDFTHGRARVIVTKPSIAGFGLNWQHCARVVVASCSYSYEQLYQALRRSWRYGQRRAVQAHVIIAESEQEIWEVLQRKLEAHEQMKSAMKAAVFSRGRESEVKTAYNPTKIDRLPTWLLN